MELTRTSTGHSHSRRLGAGAITFLWIVALSLAAVPFPQAAWSSTPASDNGQPDILTVQAPSIKKGNLAERFPAGSRIVRLGRRSDHPTNLTPGFYAATDPCVSFDGSKVLFAGKKDPSETWQIWEMSIEGTGQRQVTHSDGNCLAPAYLPREAFAFSGEVTNPDGRRAYQVYFGKLDGNGVHPITFGPGDYEVESVLPSGLILASARSNLQAQGGSANSRSLFTLRPDGSGLEALRSDNDPPTIRTQTVPVAAHPAPRWYWSTLNEKAQAGYFICLDAALSADTPKGRFSTAPVKVRVLALDTAIGKEKSLGDAPVEQDGSFYIAVPPDRSMRFELLNAQGTVMRAQKSWIWARPGEEHGCVGCHEDRAVAPENRWPLALRRFDTPTRLGLQSPLGAAH